MRRGIVNTTLTAAAVGIILLTAGCSAGRSSMGPQRPEPSEPATGPIVASIDVADTTFVMHDEGDGWVAVEVLYPGLQTTIERAPFNTWNVLSETSTCGWLVESGAEVPGECDVDLPRILYGRVTDPDIGYVCIGTINQRDGDPGFSVPGARFLTPDANGYILEEAQPGEGPFPHFLSAGGSRLGDPPLDAPSGPIYEACEAATGIEEPEKVVWVDLQLVLDESLSGNDDLTVMIVSGLDRGGISTSTYKGNDGYLPTFGVTPTAHRFFVELVDENASTSIMSVDLEWPDEIHELLSSEEACDGISVVEVSLAEGVLDGSTDAVDVRFVGSDCPGNGEHSGSSSQPDTPASIGESVVPSVPSHALGPDLCPDMDEQHPDANMVSDDGMVVAEFGFADGSVFLVRNDQQDVTYFTVAECFSGGGEGFSGGGPGETWQGCYRVDYSDAGYAIVIVEDPSWSVAVNGEPVDVGQTGDGLGAVLIEGSFDRPPSVEVLTDGACG